MRAVDLRQLIEDEVEDNDQIVFKATIDGKEYTFTLPEDPNERDFVHDGENATLVIDVQPR